MWVLFIALDEGDEEPALDGLPIHDTMLCTRAGHGNGPSVPVFGYLCSFFYLSFCYVLQVLGGIHKSRRHYERRFGDSRI
jgi:hypothetical protein